MPAKRLPWIKFWPELLEHRKFGELSDGESWTWVVVWGKASQQPERWRFVSLDHAARATGRPRKQIQRLIDVHLIDEDPAGWLTIHDVKQWQDRFPSDDPTNTPSTLRESPTEDSVNGRPKPPPTLREDSLEDSLEDSDASFLQKGEERRETKELPGSPRLARPAHAHEASPGLRRLGAALLSPEDQALDAQLRAKKRARQAMPAEPSENSVNERAR